MLLAGLLLLFTAAKPASPEVSLLGTLLREMTDRDEIARWPSLRSPAVRPAAPIPPRKRRISRAGSATGLHHFIRQETTPHGTEYVMLDADVPVPSSVLDDFFRERSGEGILRIPGRRSDRSSRAGPAA